MLPTRRGRALRHRVVFLLVLLQPLLAREAHAYLDPGSVSLFFQTLIAALLGGLLVVKRYWQQIKSGVRSLFSSRSRHDRT